MRHDTSEVSRRKRSYPGRGWVIVCAAVVMTVLAGCVGYKPARAGTASRRTLTIMTLMVGRELDFEQEAAQAYAKKQGIEVRVIPGYDSMMNRLSGYQKMFAEHLTEPDIVDLDVVWPVLLANDLVDLGPYLRAEVAAFEPRSLADFTVHGRLVALPLYLDASFLYYRSDLLKKYGFRSPPATWDDLERMATVVQAGERRKGLNDFWGFVWQGSEGEGLTCNALEWQVSEGGGSIIESDGSISVNNGRARAAIARAASWVGHISPPGVTRYKEEDSQNMFASGKAAFQRQWMYPYGEDLPPGVEIAPMPRGRARRASIDGTMAIGVSRYSRDQAEAIEFIRFLTAERLRRTRALVPVPASASPRRALRDFAVVGHTPVHDEVPREFTASLVSRPVIASAEQYDNVSRAYARAVHSVLTGGESAGSALAKLESELVRMTGRPVRRLEF